MDKLYLLVPLAAAALYATAALCFRAASVRGASPQRSTLIANLMAAAGLTVFVDWPGLARLGDVWWMVLALGTSFVVAQYLGLLALSVGDASVATPVISTKVVLVAFLLAGVVGEPVPTRVWIAAFLAVVGVFCLQADGGRRHRHVVLTILLSFLAAAGFAAFDVMNQSWSRANGFGVVVPPAIWFGAAVSLALVPFLPEARQPTPAAARFPLAVGASLMTVQAILIISVVGMAGDAAGCNVVYASRGMWSIVVVILLGRRLGVPELGGSRRILAARVLGALLILIGIGLVFL